MKKLRQTNKKGALTVNNIIAAIILIILAFGILLMSGTNIPKSYKDFEVIGKDISQWASKVFTKTDEYTAWRTGEQTKEEIKKTTRADKEFATFYKAFIDFLNTCYSATNNPCTCATVTLPIPPEGYKIVFKNIGDTTHALPLRPDDTDVTIIKGPYTFKPTKNNQFCLYGETFQPTLPEPITLVTEKGVFNLYAGGKTYQIYYPEKNENFLSLMRMPKLGKLFVETIGFSGELPKGYTTQRLKKEAICFIQNDDTKILVDLPYFMLKNECDTTEISDEEYDKALNKM